MEKKMIREEVVYDKMYEMIDKSYYSVTVKDVIDALSTISPDFKITGLEYFEATGVVERLETDEECKERMIKEEINLNNKKKLYEELKRELGYE